MQIALGATPEQGTSFSFPLPWQKQINNPALSRLRCPRCRSEHTALFIPIPRRLPLQELSYTKDVVEAGLAEDTHLYYMALVERGTGRCVSPPLVSGSRECRVWLPLFPLTLHSEAASGVLMPSVLQPSSPEERLARGDCP